jgi:CheY-like chemotaxis protein
MPVDNFSYCHGQLKLCLALADQSSDLLAINVYKAMACEFAAKMLLESILTEEFSTASPIRPDRDKLALGSGQFPNQTLPALLLGVSERHFLAPTENEVFQAPRLLLIDNDSDATTSIRRVAENAGYLVHEANTATEAQAALITFKPHAVIVELLMPEIDGIEILQMIHRSGHSPKVLVMSARGEIYLDLVRSLAFATGMAFVSTIGKPIPPNELDRFLATTLALQQGVVRRTAAILTAPATLAVQPMLEALDGVAYVVDASGIIAAVGRKGWRGFAAGWDGAFVGRKRARRVAVRSNQQRCGPCSLPQHATRDYPRPTEAHRIRFPLRRCRDHAPPPYVNVLHRRWAGRRYGIVSSAGVERGATGIAAIILLRTAHRPGPVALGDPRRGDVQFLPASRLAVRCAGPPQSVDVGGGIQPAQNT